MQNIAKNGRFAHFPKGARGEFYKNLSKIIILPLCAEELRTARQGNDLKVPFTVTLRNP